MRNNVNWGKIQKGLFQYKEIMTLYKYSANIEKDELLQLKYRSFYRMNTARKDALFYKTYFRLLNKTKYDGDGEIYSILKQLKRISNKNEISFASKLLATVNPKLPIWDARVRSRINLLGEIKLNATYKTLDECVMAYISLLLWYSKFMKTSESKKMIAEFDDHFPNQKITAIKKIDFIFWQTQSK